MGRNVGDEDRLREGLSMLVEARRLYELGQFVQCGEQLQRVHDLAERRMGDKWEFEDLMVAYNAAREDATAEQLERVRPIAGGLAG